MALPHMAGKLLLLCAEQYSVMRTIYTDHIDLDEMKQGSRRAINNIRSRIDDLRWVVDHEDHILGASKEVNVCTPGQSNASRSNDSLNEKT
jgi:hypothetical protein